MIKFNKNQDLFQFLLYVNSISDMLENDNLSIYFNVIKKIIFSYHFEATQINKNTDFEITKLAINDCEFFSIKLFEIKSICSIKNKRYCKDC